MKTFHTSVEEVSDTSLVSTTEGEAQVAVKASVETGEVAAQKSFAGRVGDAAISGG